MRRHVFLPTSFFRVAATALLAPAAGLGQGLVAQEQERPTAAEFAERALEAEAAPLFASDEPLALTLRTDIQWLRDERSDEEEVAGTVTLTGADGTEIVLPVDVRTRGEFRRMKRNCNFPPLRLNFPKSEMEGTVFEGQDKLKLVSPCHDSRDSYQDYVHYEYLAYRLYNLLTPLSNRVRLVEITFEDIEGDYDSRTKYGFLIEADEEMAARNRGTIEDVGELNPGQTVHEYGTMVSLFQYMIGNTDWSSFQFHNVKLVHTEDGGYYTVAYDFDFSGAVDARYAAPDASLPISDVRDRLFWGFCFRQVQDYAHWAEFFNERRQDITDLYMSYELLEEGDREDALKYYDDFWEVLEDERDYRREIIERCRG